MSAREPEFLVFQARRGDAGWLRSMLREGTGRASKNNPRRCVVGKDGDEISVPPLTGSTKLSFPANSGQPLFLSLSLFPPWSMITLAKGVTQHKIRIITPTSACPFIFIIGQSFLPHPSPTAPVSQSDDPCITMAADARYPAK